MTQQMWHQKSYLLKAHNQRDAKAYIWQPLNGNSNISIRVVCLFLCLFVCLGILVSLEIFSYLYGDVTIADEKLQIFYVWHYDLMAVRVLQRARPNVTRGIRLEQSTQSTHDTNTFTERLAVELSLPVLTTQVYRGWNSNTQLLLVWRTLQPTALQLKVKILEREMLNNREP